VVRIFSVLGVLGFCKVAGVFGAPLVSLFSLKGWRTRFCEELEAGFLGNGLKEISSSISNSKTNGQSFSSDMAIGSQLFLEWSNTNDYLKHTTILHTATATNNQILESSERFSGRCLCSTLSSLSVCSWRPRQPSQDTSRNSAHRKRVGVC
jgi:hypothetical protein